MGYEMGTRIPKAEMVRRLEEGIEAVRTDTIRQVALNTVEYYTESGDHCIKLYDTVIIRFVRSRGHTCDGVVLNSGCHRTVTTKRRMNDLQAYLSVWQEKGAWWVADKDSNKVMFHDGIAYHCDTGHFFESCGMLLEWLDGKDVKPLPTEPGGSLTQVVLGR